VSAIDQARALFRQGRKADAVALVEHQAAAGDAESLLMLAHWRLFALYGPRDLEAAHRSLEAAAAKGNVEAARTRAFLVANGTGSEPDPALARELLERIAPLDSYAALQLQFLPRMKSAAAAQAAQREVLSADPRIELVRGLLSAEECRYVMTLAEPALEPSFVIHPVSGQRVPHPTRTSHGASFGPVQEDLVINAINRRLAEATGTEAGWGEPLHVLRYRPGEQYKPHVDALPGVTNQRTWTALVYLNEGYGGGETEFPELGIAAKGEAGDVLIFHNVLADGRGDPRTRHAGLPVTSGVKWLATRWIRQSRYHPWEM
jgi:prolyl 4-hydroxylase